MDARIHRFHWKGEVHGDPSAVTALGGRLRRISADYLSDALDGALSSRLGGDPTVYVLRRVENRFFHNDAIPAMDAEVARLWAGGLAEDIVKVIDKAAEGNVARFRDQADYVASYVEDALEGTADSAWCYGPLTRFLNGLPPVPAGGRPAARHPGHDAPKGQSNREGDSIGTAVIGVLEANRKDLGRILGRLFARDRLSLVLDRLTPAEALRLWTAVTDNGAGVRVAASSVLSAVLPPPAVQANDIGGMSPLGGAIENLPHGDWALKGLGASAAMVRGGGGGAADGLEAVSQAALRIVEGLGLWRSSRPSREAPVVATPGALAAAFRRSWVGLLDWREAASLSEAVLSVLWFLHRQGLIGLPAEPVPGGPGDIPGADAPPGVVTPSGIDNANGEALKAVSEGTAWVAGIDDMAWRAALDGPDWLDGTRLRQGLDILLARMAAAPSAARVGGRDGREEGSSVTATGTGVPSGKGFLHLPSSSALPTRPSLGRATPHQKRWLGRLAELVRRGEVAMVPGSGNEAVNALSLLGAVVADTAGGTSEDGHGMPADAATDRVLATLIAAAVTVHAVEQPIPAVDGAAERTETVPGPGAVHGAGGAHGDEYRHAGKSARGREGGAPDLPEGGGSRDGMAEPERTDGATRRAIQLMTALGEPARSLMKAMAEASVSPSAAARGRVQARMAAKGQWIESRAAGVFHLLRGIMDCRFAGLSARLDYPGGSATLPDDLLYALALRWAGGADPALGLVAGLEPQKDRAALARVWHGVDDAAHDAFQGALFGIARNQRLLADGDVLHVWRLSDAPSHPILIGGTLRIWPFTAPADSDSDAAEALTAWAEAWSGGTAGLTVVVDEDTLPAAWKPPGGGTVVLAPRLPPEPSAALEGGVLSDHLDGKGILMKTLHGMEGGRLGEPRADVTLALAAALTVSVWGRWLHGIGSSSAPYLLDNLIRRPGRVRLDPDRGLEVDVEPGPLDVVLGLSGYTDPIESVPWLGGLGVAFTRGGEP